MDDLREEYLEWLISKVNNREGMDKWVIEERAKSDHPEQILDLSWIKLYRYLDTIEFKYTHPMDKNRYEDGISLRWQYEYEEQKPKGTSDLITGPCSMFEMMCALAFRIENLMENPELGDRTKYWFSRMLYSLGLRTTDFTNEFFDTEDTQKMLTDILDTFFKREYEPDGHGGLFIVYDSPEDMTKLEIWIQMQRWISLRD